MIGAVRRRECRRSWAALGFVREANRSAIRRSRSEFSLPRGSRTARSENFFGGKESSEDGARGLPRDACGCAPAFRAHRMHIGAHARNPCAAGVFVCRRNFRARDPRARTQGIVAGVELGDGSHGEDGGRSGRPPFVKRSRCFFRCAVVIGVQCMSIRDCTVPKIAISMARRAVWRREPNRRRSPRRKRLRRRRSAKRRAERSSLRRVHAIGLQSCRAWRRICRRAPMPACATLLRDPPTSRRRRASAISRFNLHRVGVGLRPMVGSSSEDEYGRHRARPSAESLPVGIASQRYRRRPSAVPRRRFLQTFDQIRLSWPLRQLEYPRTLLFAP